jgi:hypothetical protein
MRLYEIQKGSSGTLLNAAEKPLFDSPSAAE